MLHDLNHPAMISCGKSLGFSPRLSRLPGDEWRGAGLSAGRGRQLRGAGEDQGAAHGDPAGFLTWCTSHSLIHLDGLWEKNTLMIMV